MGQFIRKPQQIKFPALKSDSVVVESRINAVGVGRNFVWIPEDLTGLRAAFALIMPQYGDTVSICYQSIGVQTPPDSSADWFDLDPGDVFYENKPLKSALWLKAEINDVPGIITLTYFSASNEHNQPKLIDSREPQ